MLKKIALGLTGFLVIVAGVALIGAWRVGAWHLIFPTSHHETVPPDLPEDLGEPAILVFSKTNAFRHFDGIKGGRIFFEQLSRTRGWGFHQTENGAVFNTDDLARFSVVVFNNATGDILNDDQEEAFRAWLEAGGGWLGIHSAGDDSHADWTWYTETLIGANFIAHTMGPQFQIATVHVEDTSHVSTQHVPLSWQHTEEWYSWDKSVRTGGFNVLLSVDESTYTPRMQFLGSDLDLRMGDHPVAWNRCVGEGRALYSALGHSGDAFQTAEYQTLLEGAMNWLLQQTPCSEITAP